MIVICNKFDKFKCTDCVHAIPHNVIQIDNSPCTCKGWCIPPSENIGIETKCIEYQEENNE